MAHYYDAEPTAPSDRKVISYRKNGMNFEFITDTNVFSRNAVDRGTDLLLDETIRDLKASGVSKGESFLDLGCGCGVVGIVLKSVFMACDVVQVDINERAVALSQENAKLNSVKMTKCVQSNVLEALDKDMMFDAVITNPPVRAGKQTVFAFYEQAYDHLKPGGSIYVVLQRKQGAPSSAAKLESLYGNCDTLGIDGGYRVMRATKSTEATD
ncbi:MAG: class I SAM-dependent methyltransferase [Clostridiales bacterium]|nr:class I SAM-dependent methyltransferase [Clostridiales bacterium]